MFYTCSYLQLYINQRVTDWLPIHLLVSVNHLMKLPDRCAGVNTCLHLLWPWDAGHECILPHFRPSPTCYTYENYSLHHDSFSISSCSWTTPDSMSILHLPHWPSKMYTSAMMPIMPVWSTPLDIQWRCLTMVISMLKVSIIQGTRSLHVSPSLELFRLFFHSQIWMISLR